MQDESAASENIVVDKPARPSVGRPRAPDMESRIYDAAIAIFAEGGWRALTFDNVARAAGVGKSAIYRRWTDRGDLLRQTLEARWYAVGTIDEGNLREDLLALARMCFTILTGPYGSVPGHLRADAKHFKDARAATEPYWEQTVLQARQIIRRAMARGELAPDFNASLLIDIVIGSVTNHITSTPRRLRAAMLAKSAAYIVELIDLALRGAGLIR